MLAASMLVIAVLGWAALDSKGVRASEPIPVTLSQQQVVVVHRDLSPDQEVAAEDIRVELRTVGTAPNDAFADPQQVVGRRPIAHLGIGMPLTPSLFAERESAPVPAKPEPVEVARPAPVEAPPVTEPAVAAAERSESRAKGRGFASYVWVNGGPTSFGIDESGALHVVDRLGNVMPLDSNRSRTAGDQ